MRATLATRASPEAADVFTGGCTCQFTKGASARRSRIGGRLLSVMALQAEHVASIFFVLSDSGAAQLGGCLRGAGAGAALRFVQEPQDAVAAPGQHVLLPCAAELTGAGGAALDLGGGGAGGGASRVLQLQRQLDNGSLVIRAPIDAAARHLVEGRYRCVAVLEALGTLVSRAASVRIAGPPRIERGPEAARLLPGQTAFLRCDTRGIPAPSVRWLRDGRPLKLDASRMVVLPSGALEISQVWPLDQGSYQCNASSLQQSQLSAPAVLSVDQDRELDPRPIPPRFIATPHASVVATEGHNVTLDCAANGPPEPDISWLKDGSSIDLKDRDSRFMKVGTGSLRISHVQEKDRGTYQCRAGNRADLVDATTTLEVEVPPRFVKRPKDREAFEKEDLELECSVYGKPEPKVYWMKNGDLIKPSDYMHVVNGNNLKILGLMRLDTGIFQCLAMNPAGNIQASARLQIYPPASELSGNANNPSSVLNPGSNLKHNRGPFFLDENDDDEDIDDDGDEDNDDDDDYDYNYEDNDDYDARLDEDSLDRFSKLKNPTPLAPPTDDAVAPVRDVPSAPEGLTAVIVATRFVTLSWKPPANPRGEILVYSVYYRKEGSPRERILNTTRSQLEEANIPGLMPDKLYHFRVVAYNEQGAGASSETLSIRTDPEVHVLGPPRSLAAIPVSPNALLVIWQPPVDAPAGPPQGYKLFYMEVGSAEEHRVETQETHFNLTGLTPYTEYSVWVIAYNQNGQGSSTEEVTARTLSAPPSDCPQNVTLEPTSSSSILVRWEPPPKEGRNGLITGYKLRFRKRDRRGRGGDGANTISTPGDRRSLALPELERGAHYQPVLDVCPQVRLWAMNVNGTGPPTEWFSVETFENDLIETTVPDSPHGLKTRAMVDSITVSWSPPRNQNIMVRGYTLGWGKGIPDVYTKLLDGKQRYYVIENLEPTSEYVISLRAYNEMGDGPPAYSSVRTLDNIAPEPITPLHPPVGLMAIVLSSRSVVLYWTDTTLSKNQQVTDSRYYVVRYTSQHHASSPRYKYFNASDLNCMIDDLKPNTQYEFTVKTVRGRRESPWSMVVLNMTQEDQPYSPPRDLTVVPVAENPTMVNMNWQPPKQPNGPITGYLILYTTDSSLPDREWVVEGIVGDRMTTTVKSLTPETTYYFKIQARNSKGYGPFSSVVSFTTGPNGRGIPQTIVYIVIGCSVVVFTVLVGLGILVCCKRRSAERSKKGYMKGAIKGKPGKQNIKPPDLWIHHDQMELKALQQQAGVSGSIGGPSGDGGGPSGVPATLPRTSQTMGSSDFDQDHHDGTKFHSNSLDKRGYVSSYIGQPMDPSAGRPVYPRTQYSISRAHVTLDPAAGATVAAVAPVSNTVPPEGPYALQGGYDAVGVGGANTHAVPLSMPQSSHQQHAAQIVPPSAYGAGMQAVGVAGEAGASGTLGKRTQGHPLKSFSVPAPPPQSAPSTPQQKHIAVSSVTIRPQGSCSPYKKAGHLASGTSGTSTPPPVTIPSAPGSAGSNKSGRPTPDSHAQMQPSYSTEELNQEMANLEGLMKDLNAITASEFEC
ncbi:Contactin [Gryllus bimaculatus]|nr:Contactin [Gryllus bimaculatus]